jgi:hypothetical protein
VDINEASEKGWQLARHFKLHLHPMVMKAQNSISCDPLPQNVTINQIYADFFRYVYDHTKYFFEEREDQGARIWQNLKEMHHIEFLIAHPNGWTLSEQAFLRQTAVDAGLVIHHHASRTVHMISEAEASVHFVMFHGGVENHLQVC